MKSTTADSARVAAPLSDRISKDLGKRGFKFVGSTIIYAYMQAIGMVDDHIVGCICHGKASGKGRKTST